MELIIIYDSNCTFCCEFAEWSLTQNTEFEIVSVRSKEAKNHFRKLGINFINLQTIYFLDNGKIFKKSVAIFRIMSLMPLPWKMISWLRILPTCITDYSYSIFAKYRHRIKI